MKSRSKTGKSPDSFREASDLKSCPNAQTLQQVSLREDHPATATHCRRNATQPEQVRTAPKPAEWCTALIGQLFGICSLALRSEMTGGLHEQSRSCRSLKIQAGFGSSACTRAVKIQQQDRYRKDRPVLGRGKWSAIHKLGLPKGVGTGGKCTAGGMSGRWWGCETGGGGERGGGWLLSASLADTLRPENRLGRCDGRRPGGLLGSACEVRDSRRYRRDPGRAHESEPITVAEAPGRGVGLK